MLSRWATSDWEYWEESEFPFSCDCWTACCAMMVLVHHSWHCHSFPRLLTWSWIHMTPVAARGKFQRHAESPGQSLQQLTQCGGDYSQIKLINLVSGSGSGCSAVLLWVFSPGAYAMGMWLCLCTPQASAGVVLVLLEVLFNESWPKCHLRLKHSQVTLLSLED